MMQASWGTDCRDGDNGVDSDSVVVSCGPAQIDRAACEALNAPHPPDESGNFERTLQLTTHVAEGPGAIEGTTEHYRIDLPAGPGTGRITMVGAGGTNVRPARMFVGSFAYRGDLSRDIPVRLDGDPGAKIMCLRLEAWQDELTGTFWQNTKPVTQGGVRGQWSSTEELLHYDPNTQGSCETCCDPWHTDGRTGNAEAICIEACRELANATGQTDGQIRGCGEALHRFPDGAH